MGVQYEKICALLTETVMLMCKNGVQYNDELKVQGLIGLTADKDVYIIQINEVIRAEPNERSRMSAEIQNVAHTSSNSQRESFNQDNCVQNLSASNYQEKNQINPCYIAKKENLNLCESSSNTFKHNNLHNIVKKISSTHVSNKESNVEASETPPLAVHSSSNCITEGSDTSGKKHLRENQKKTQNSTNKYYEQDSYTNNDNDGDPDMQDYPIDLHINYQNHENNENDDANKHDNSNIITDVKPSVNELEEWVNRVEYKAPVLNKRKRQSKSLSAKPAQKLKANRLSNNVDNTLNSTWDMDFKNVGGSSSEYLGASYISNQDDYDADLNNNSMIYDSSKYHCNLCTASYKHYCNLLTHEVKVHGRQKKRGGRKRKTEDSNFYASNNKASSGVKNSSTGEVHDKDEENADGDSNDHDATVGVEGLNEENGVSNETVEA